jgi:hypothetical protein
MCSFLSAAPQSPGRNPRSVASADRTPRTGIEPRSPASCRAPRPPLPQNENSNQHRLLTSLSFHGPPTTGTPATSYPGRRIAIVEATSEPNRCPAHPVGACGPRQVRCPDPASFPRAAGSMLLRSVAGSSAATRPRTCSYRPGSATVRRAASLPASGANGTAPACDRIRLADS